MSKQKVYNYVMNTPHNTNPSVLASLLDEPTSWNDLTDKPFYEEIVEILPETTVEIDPETGFGMLPNMTIYADNEYTIKYNGTEYVCVCVVSDMGELVLGNYGVLEEENPVDTGEPFIMCYTVIDEDDSGNPIYDWVLMALDGSTSVTLCVKGEGVTKISKKYIDYTPSNQYTDTKIEQLRVETKRYASDLLYNTHNIDLDICFDGHFDFDDGRFYQCVVGDVAEELNQAMRESYNIGHPRMIVSFTCSKGEYSEECSIPIQVSESNLNFAGYGTTIFLGDSMNLFSRISVSIKSYSFASGAQCHILICKENLH